MEISKNDIVSAKISFKEGVLFSCVFKQFCGWEKMSFAPIKRPKITQKEQDELSKKYEEKYGEV